MSYQYSFCPTCGTRRVAHGYRCSVCDGLVRRTPQVRIAPNTTRTLVSWSSHETANKAIADKATRREAVAA
jgi:hypothetical protein